MANDNISKQVRPRRWVGIVIVSLGAVMVLLIWGVRTLQKYVGRVSQGHTEVVATFPSPDGRHKAILTRYTDAFGISSPASYGVKFETQGDPQMHGFGWDVGAAPSPDLQFSWSKNNDIAAAWEKGKLFGLVDLAQKRVPYPRERIEYVDVIELPENLRSEYKTPLEAMAADRQYNCVWLTHAVFIKNIKLIHRLVDAGVSINCSGGEYGGNPITTAVDFGTKELIKELIALGADPNGNQSRNFPGKIKL